MKENGQMFLCCMWTFFLCFSTLIIVITTIGSTENHSQILSSGKNAFIASSVILLSICIPYTLEKAFYFLESASLGSRKSVVSVFSSILLFDFLSIYLISENSDIFNISIMCYIRRTIVILHFISVMKIISPQIFKNTRNIILITTLCTSQIFACLNSYIDSIQGRMILVIFQFISEIVFCLTYLYCLTNIFQQDFSVKSMDPDERRTGKITTVMIIFISIYTLYSICSGGSWLFDKTNNSLLIFDIYITTVIFAVVSILNELLVRAKLVVTQNMKIKDMKGTVARYLSHQLRTPVNTVTLALHCLKSQVNTNEVCAEGTELVDDAITAVSAVTTVLENIITYESLSASTLKMYPRVVYPADYIKDTLRLHFDIAKQKSIGFEVKSDTLIDVDTNAVCISIDSIRFSQVINTLVGNAIKYTKKGGKVTVSVEYCQLEKDHHHNGNDNAGNDYSAVIQGSKINASGMLKIRVTDTGRGIAKESLPGLFERSLRFNPGLEEKDQGSGLSLWITRRLVDLHRYCTLEVESEGVGRGTQFVLSIPFYEQPEKLFVPLCRNSMIPIMSIRKDYEEDSISENSSIFNDTSTKISIHNFIFRDKSKAYENKPFDENRSEASCTSRRRLPSALFLKITGKHDTFAEMVYESSGVDEKSGGRERDRCKDKDRDRISSGKDCTCECEESYRSKFSSTPSLEHIEHEHREDFEFKVLIVDDAPMTLKMIVRVMKSKCKFITEAKDGAEAVERMKEAMEPGNMPFHFVMMDYQMPVMDGPSAAKAMREMGFTGPIIGVTGNAVRSDLRKYLSCGANEVLTKPLDVSQLEEVLKEHDINLPNDINLRNAQTISTKELF